MENKQSEAFESIKDNICERVKERIDYSKDTDEEEILKIIDNEMIAYPGRKAMSVDNVLKLRTEIFYSLRKYDIIQEYLEDDDITEIMINGPDAIFIEKEGNLIKTEKAFSSKEKLEDIIQQMVGACNRAVNEAYPIADARLSTGERVNVVLPPVALNGPIVTIRKFSHDPITMDKLIEYEAISKEAADFLEALVKAKYNIFISGGTGTGKTTFLNVLSQFIPTDERIITIEDSAELRLLNSENIVRLETRNKNTEGARTIDIRDLIKSALRMRPDRIIVGEIRGAEAVDMLQAMNTGHDGSLSTGHGNSPKDMISRLEMMVLMGMDIPIYAVRQQIAGGIDVMVHLERLKDRRRVISKITEIEGYENGEIIMNTLFELEGTVLAKVGNLKNVSKLRKETVH